MPSKTIEDFAYQIKDYMRSAEVVEGKNLFPPTVYPLGIPTTSTGTSAFNDTPTATMFISKVDNNTDYVISRSTGDRFRIALSVDMPAVDVVCNVIINDPSLDDAQFNSGNYNYVAFFVNNASPETADVIEPMLCTLTEWNKSQTYEPYYVPVKDSMFKRSEQAVLGAKNLLNIRDVNTELYGTTLVTNANRTITVTTGTTNASVNILDKTIGWKVGKYKFWCKGTTNIVYVGLQYLDSNNSWNNYPSSYVKDGTYSEFDITQEMSTYGIRVFLQVIGQSSSITTTVYPMITLATETDDTYVPYAMTNRELTEVVEHTLTPNSKLNVSNVKCISCGRIHSLTFLATATQSIGQDESLFTGTIPYGSTPYYFFKTTYGDKMCEIQNGKIVIKSSADANDVIRGSVTWIY